MGSEMNRTAGSTFDTAQSTTEPIRYVVPLAGLYDLLTPTSGIACSCADRLASHKHTA